MSKELTTVSRETKNKFFTVISNYILDDNRPSSNAKIVLITALRNSDNWVYHLSDFAKRLSMSKSTLLKALAELEKFGYLERRKISRRETFYHWYEKPKNISYDEFMKCYSVKTVIENDSEYKNSARFGYVESSCGENVECVETGFSDDSEFNNCTVTVQNLNSENDLTVQKMNSTVQNSDTRLSKNCTLINTNNKYYSDSIQSDKFEKKFSTKNPIDKIDKTNTAEIEKEVREQIGYEKLISEKNPESVNEIKNIICGVLTSKAKTMRICKEDMPIENVKERYRQLNYKLVDCAIFKLESTTTKIHNMKNYIRTVLYSACETMENDYRAEKNYKSKQNQDYGNYSDNIDDDLQDYVDLLNTPGGINGDDNFDEEFSKKIEKAEEMGADSSVVQKLYARKYGKSNPDYDPELQPYIDLLNIPGGISE